MALDLHSSEDGDGNRKWDVTTAPTLEPITAAEVKTYARIDGDDEDTLIGTFITAVRQATEQYLGRALITQTITLSMDYWPSLVIELPRPPLISVTSVSTVDEDDTSTTYSSDNYYVRTVGDPGTIVIKRDGTLPINTDRDFGGFEIVYTAGYGATASDVPAAIREAMKLWVAMIYETRVPIKDPPEIAKTLMDFYRVKPL